MTANDFEGDIIYAVWRSGRNPDMINLADVRDYYEQGLTEEEVVQILVSAQRPQRPERFDWGS